MSLPSDNRILFFRRDRAAFGFLSNFHPAPIRLNDEAWPTVEHCYQAQKSLDPAYREAIRAASTPGMAKRLAATPAAPSRASRQSWFRRHCAEPRADWHEVKLAIMRRAVFAKFTQNPEIGDLLLRTGTAELVEDSPTEPFFGASAPMEAA